jgi:hypothetical protein
MTQDDVRALQLLVPAKIHAVGRAGSVFSLMTDKLKVGIWCAWRLEVDGLYACGSGDQDYWDKVDRLEGRTLTAIHTNSNSLDLHLQFDDGSALFVFCHTAKDPWHIDASSVGYLTPLP